MPLVLVHVAQDFFHRYVADGPLKEYRFDPGGWHVFQQWQHQQQPTKPDRLAGVLVPGVLTEHDVRLVLQVLHLYRVFQPACV